MFGNILYLNKKKVEQYSALILGKNYEASHNNSSEDNTVNALYMCSEFEKILQKRDDYVDFVGDSQNTSIQDVRISSIIRVSGEIYIPEQFDIIHLIGDYKSLLLSSVEYKDDDEKTMLKTMFDKSTMRIPIYCELGSACDYWMGIGKISPKDLLIEYNDLEDYEGTDVTILARLESRKYYKDKPIPVYDIYKDFLGLNRALRKEIKTSKKSFESIEVEEDFLALELLAIYC